MRGVGVVPAGLGVVLVVLLFVLNLCFVCLSGCAFGILFAFVLSGCVL